MWYHWTLSNLCPKDHGLELPQGLSSKESSNKAGDVGLIPGLGRSPAEGNAYLLRYSSVGNPMDRGVWWVTVHGIAKGWTRFSD